jgi:phage terminase large subunit-like protein
MARRKDDDSEDLAPEVDPELKERAENDLVEFIRMMWHVLEPATPLVEGWVLYALCDYLMAVADGHIKRGILNFPPGSGKSLVLNVFYPAWLWGPRNRPHLRFICASYNEELPSRDNARFLRLIKDITYQAYWGHVFELNKESAGWIENTRTGWKRTTSTHSGTTGHRGDYILIDDPNDPNNVESPTVRHATVHWLREVMPDRLNNLDEGVIICLQQRTHQEDATGVLAEYGVGYTDAWMMIPMQFDPLRSMPIVLRRNQDGEPTEIWMDPRGVDKNGNELEGIFIDKEGKRKLIPNSPMAKADGKLAWPERFSPAAVKALERTKGKVAWASQYQQSPTPRGGDIIQEDWWRVWPERKFPDMGTVFCALSVPADDKEEMENYGATFWGSFEGKEGEPLLMLMDAWKDKIPLSQTATRIAELCYKHKADYLLIANRPKGAEIYAEIRRLYADAPWSVVLVNLEGGDRSRLEAVSVLFSGDVKRLPKPKAHPRDPDEFIDDWTGGVIFAPATDWADVVISDCGAFPRSKNVEYVNSVSMAVGWARKNGVVVRKAEYDAARTERLKFRPPMGAPYAI